MKKALILEFTKMHGAGNDFLVLDNRFFFFSDAELSDLARRLCPRRFGIGADGLLALATAQEPGTSFHMRYFNADGSAGSMCGNGARCLVRFAVEAGIEGPELRFSSDAGIYKALLLESDPFRVRLFVPPPQAYQPNVPLENAVSGRAVHGIWTGVPHAVCFVDHLEGEPVMEEAPSIRHDPSFQAGANVDFVEIVSAEEPALLKVRTFERGVEAETLACGTGALASAVVAYYGGRVRATVVDVDMPGGRLRVGFEPRGELLTDLYLEGPAEVVFRGSCEV